MLCIPYDLDSCIVSTYKTVEWVCLKSTIAPGGGRRKQGMSVGCNGNVALSLVTEKHEWNDIFVDDLSHLSQR